MVRLFSGPLGGAGKVLLNPMGRPQGLPSLFSAQTAIFEPRGVAGLLYWYALYPVHRLIFNGMLRGIARRASS